MTDLSAKFTALETALTGKLDTVIARLDSVITLLSQSSGSIDAAPIVAAIEGLRGLGPENTIKSVNQSIWNMVGPAPGHTLTDIYNLFNPGAGVLPYNLLDLIYTTLSSLKNGVGTPTGDATTTLLGRLSSVQYALTDNAANAANLFGAIRAINDAVGGSPNSSLEIASVRGLLSALLTDATQFGVLPDGLDLTEISSSTTMTSGGYRYVVWPDVIGVTRLEENTVLQPNTDWDGYAIYIQTDSPTFVLYDHTDPQQNSTMPSNCWIPLAGNHKLAMAVDAHYQVRGFIRIPAVVAPACFDVIMKSVTFQPGTLVRQIVDWAGSPLEQYADDYPYNFSGTDRTAQGGVLPILNIPSGTIDGYTIWSNKSYKIYRNGSASNYYAGTIYTVPAGTTRLYVEMYQDSAITVNVCPPGLRP